MTNQTLIKTLFLVLFAIILLLSSIIFWLINVEEPPQINTPLPKKISFRNPPRENPITEKTSETPEPPIIEKIQKTFPPLKHIKDNSSKNIPHNSEKVKSKIIKNKKVLTKQKYFYEIDKSKIKRYPGYASFLLLDRRSKIIALDATIMVKLWRKLGPYTLQEDVFFSSKHSSIYCSGADYKGMEKGQYYLQIISKKYGSLQHSFEITNHKTNIKDILYLPYYRKIISFNFVDSENQPIKYLSHLPEYTPNYFSRLRNQPNIFEDSIFYDNHTAGFNRQSNSNKKLKKEKKKLNLPSKHLTDQGLLYFAVYVGNRARLKIPFKNSKKYLLEVTSKFEEHHWNEYTIQVNNSKSYLTYVDSVKKIKNKNDPGYKSLKQRLSINNQTKERKPFIVPNKIKSDQALTIFTINSNARLSLLYKKEQDSESAITIMPQNNKIFLNLSKKNLSNTRYINYAFTDKKFYLSDWQLHIPNYGIKKYYRYSFFLKSIKLELESTPTLTELLYNRTRVKGKNVVNFNFKKSDDQLILNSYIDLNATNNLNNYKKLKLYFNNYTEIKKYNKLFNFNKNHKQISFYSKSHTNYSTIAKSNLNITHKIIDKIKTGSYKFRNLIKGVVFKVIDDNNAGLPWVEVAIFPMEQKEEILKNLKLFNKHLDNQTRSTLLYWIKNRNKREIYRDYHPQTIISRNEGFKLAEKLSPYFAIENNKKGSYKTIISDKRGYVFINKNNLAPGNNYVLYLYSNSREILNPDKILPFTATKGITDLGAIELPNYQQN
ncbi:MAG: hypothetical protein COA79_01940 [Planctomycetota bacterium]|nr:MAG: hypothetical protein COA79_01940 [Planctomycetota bacterium]